MKKNRIPYFIDPDKAKEFTKMEGLKTKILTGLNGEKMCF